MPLEMPILCECGKSIVVSEVAVGCTESCVCGKALAVPPLTEFRLHHGLPAVKPNYRGWIIDRLNSGELPPPRCQQCDAETTGEFAFLFDTEFKLNEQARNNALAGGLIVGGTGVQLTQFFAKNSSGVDDLFVPVVLRMCPQCREDVLQSRIVLAWRAAKWILLLAGLIAFFFEPITGIALMVASAFLWATEDRLRSRRVQRIRGIMERSPAYRALMVENPRGQPVL